MLRRRKKKSDKDSPWRKAVLFRELPAEALDALSGILERRELRAGDYLAREGEEASELYWVETGSIEVLKKELQRDVQHPIETIAAGDCVGELSLVDGLPRSTSARAITPSVVWSLPFSKIKPSAERLRATDRQSVVLNDAYQRLVLNLAQILSARLRSKAVESLEAARHRAAMGQFIINVLILLVVYLVVVSGLPHVRDRLPSSTSYVSIPLQILFGVGSWAFIRGTGYPMAHFGLGFSHLLGSVLEALVFTVPFLAFVTAIKWVLWRLGDGWTSAPLIAHPDVIARLREPAVMKLLSIYFVASAVQELIVRSALQSSLETFLTGPGRTKKAIVVSGVLFAATHIHMGFLFAALAFVPGVFWGWLFARRRNLVGVTLSHVAVGAYVFFILGASI